MPAYIDPPSPWYRVMARGKGWKTLPKQPDAVSVLSRVIARAKSCTGYTEPTLKEGGKPRRIKIRRVRGL